MTKTKVHGSFPDTPAKPGGVKEDGGPAAARKAATEKTTARTGTRHHAAVCHTHAGGGRLGGKK